MFFWYCSVTDISTERKFCNFKNGSLPEMEIHWSTGNLRSKIAKVRFNVNVELKKKLKYVIGYFNNQNWMIARKETVWMGKKGIIAQMISKNLMILCASVFNLDNVSELEWEKIGLTEEWKWRKNQGVVSWDLCHSSLKELTFETAFVLERYFGICSSRSGMRNFRHDSCI